MSLSTQNMPIPTERTSRRGLVKPLTASWNPDENVAIIDKLLDSNLPDGVLIENRGILRALGQLPVPQNVAPK